MDAVPLATDAPLAEIGMTSRAVADPTAVDTPVALSV
jgi:hypothetical protein